MTSITITDTGKYTTRDAAVTDEVKANSGSAITLKGVKITLDLTQLLGVGPVVSKLKNDTATEQYDFTEVDSQGFEFPKWKIEGRFNFNNSADRTNFHNICKCAITKGIKKIDTDAGDTKTTPMTKYSLYADSASVTYIYVKIKHIHFEQNARSNMITYVIEAIETGGLSTNLT